MREPCDVLLVMPLSRPGGERFGMPDYDAPLGICCLAAWLERAGRRTALLDFGVESPGADLASLAAGLNPKFVGFTTYTPYMSDAARLAAEAKSLWPECVTVMGGYHASALPERTLAECAAADYVVVGEGEGPLLSLIEAVESGKAVENISGLWRRNGGGFAGSQPTDQVDITRLPHPAREKLPLERYRMSPINATREPAMGILSGRGCNRKCTFCAQSVWKGLRIREAAEIVDEMTDCNRRFGAVGFRFYDDNLTASRRHCVSFCEELLKNKTKFTWNCFSRVDTVDDELLALMRRAGCVQIKYGVETGSRRMTDELRKGTTLEQNAAAVSATRRAGIESQINLIIGLPGESAEDIRETFRHARTLEPDLISVNPFKPFPGSPLYDELARDGKIEPLPWEAYSVKHMRPIVKDSLTGRELYSLIREGYLGFFFRPAHIARRLRWFVRFPLRETRRAIEGIRTLSRGFEES